MVFSFGFFQLWKISHSLEIFGFTLKTYAIMHYHLLSSMGEENQVLGKGKIILD